MPEPTARRERIPLTVAERLAAIGVAAALMGIALWIVVNPPDRTVALSGCRTAAEGCLVSVDADTTTFAAAIAAVGAGLGLIALLGVRFTSLKAGGVELTYESTTGGLPEAEPQPRADEVVGAGGAAAPELIRGGMESPVEVEVVDGLGTEVGVVPVAVTSLVSPMNRSQAVFLRDYQSCIRVRQKGWFDGLRGADGRFGIATEAYGPFLALCEVEFTDGARVLLDHYCDFEMGALITS